MICAEAALVTARKRSTSKAVAPALPSNAEAAEGAARPAEMSSAVRIGIAGSPAAVSATAASPIAVAKTQGTASHARPPIRNAFTAVEGSDATPR